MADDTFDRLAGLSGLVTGAARGIGAACGTKLASHGARVLLADRDQDALEEAADRITKDGGEHPVWSPDGRQIAFIRWDVSDLPRSLTPYIYLVDADGTSEPVLLAQGEHPSWSPDGTRIAFTRYVNQ